MKQRLTIINILLPCLCLLALGYAPEFSFNIPEYVIIALLAVALGRAYLLLQQQVVFALLPMLLIFAPAINGIHFDIEAPWVLHSVAIYFLVVNLQWGQKPWMHPLHLLNIVLFIIFALLATRTIPITDYFPALTTLPIQELILACAIIPLPFMYYWQRLSRMGAYWPSIAIIVSYYHWADNNHIALWLSLAILLSLTLDAYFMAYVDELTGVLGRRAMTFKLKTLNNHYCLAMLDVDHFKNFNDKHGHQVGDDVLKVVAKLMAQTKGATAYRYGGEEFVLVFAKGSVKENLQRVEDCRELIEKYPLHPKNLPRKKSQRGKIVKSRPLHVTASFGLAQQQSGESLDDVIKRADSALYKAKNKGRNCVVLAK